jgi:hypothetical protein
MGSIHFLKEIPKDKLVIEEETKEALIAAEVWENIGEYAEGYPLPTNPSPGRVYRRGEYLRLVLIHPDKPDMCIHLPYKAVIV